MSLRRFRVALKQLAQAEVVALQATEAVLAGHGNVECAIAANRKAQALCRTRRRTRITVQRQNGQRAVAKAFLAVSP